VDNNDSSTLHGTVSRLAHSAGATVAPLMTAAVDEGTDLGSNSVVPVRAPRVALLGGSPVSGNSYGFAWYTFDQRLGYPATGIDADAVGSGLLEEFDVLIMPSAGGIGGALGESGLAELQRWVRRGGVLITLENASQWLASEQSGLSRFRPAPSPRSDSAGGALPVNNPGAIVRTLPDTLSPLLAGLRDAEWPVQVSGNRVFAAPRDVRAGVPRGLVLRARGTQRSSQFSASPRLGGKRSCGYVTPADPATATAVAATRDTARSA
jgi:hypothetical protein